MKKNKNSSMYFESIPYDENHKIESALLSKPAMALMFGSAILMGLVCAISIMTNTAMMLLPNQLISPLSVTCFSLIGIWCLSTASFVSAAIKRKIRHHFEKRQKDKNVVNEENKAMEQKEEQTIDATLNQEKNIVEQAKTVNEKSSIEQALKKVYTKRKNSKATEQTTKDENTDELTLNK